MNLILLGLPGAGKGTQAKMISQEYNLPHVATGDIFRKAIKNETVLGKKAKSFLDAGELVPDEVTIGIVRERLQEEDCKDGFILDGFPRTLNQANSLTEMLSAMDKKIELALYIKVKEQELISRLSGRRVCTECGATYHMKFNPPAEEGICDNCSSKLVQRSDDEEATVKNRIEVNQKQMVELIDYYEQTGILETIESTNSSIEEVFSLIKDLIEENA